MTVTAHKTDMDPGRRVRLLKAMELDPKACRADPYRVVGAVGPGADVSCSHPATEVRTVKLEVIASAALALSASVSWSQCQRGLQRVE